MSDLTLAFSPLVPWSALIVLGAAGRRRAGADGGQTPAWRAAPGVRLSRLLIAALADPSLVREKRDPQKSVVAVVVDKSDSQNFGARNAQTEEARKALDSALAKFGDVETRTITVANDASGNDGTKLFGALAEVLKDVPSERVGGGDSSDRRRRSRYSRQGGSARLQGARSSARDRTSGRARPPHRARRGAALRHRRQGSDHPRARRRSWRRWRRHPDFRAPRRRSAADLQPRAGRHRQHSGAHRTWRAKRRRARNSVRARRADAARQ